MMCDIGKLEEEVKSLKQRVSSLELESNVIDKESIRPVIGKVKEEHIPREGIYNLQNEKIITKLETPEHIVRVGDVLEINSIKYRLKSLGLSHPAYVLKDVKYENEPNYIKP